MADRFPLILNTSANQIQEIASGDTLDLSGTNIKGVGIITATNISGNIIAGAGTSNIVSGILTAVAADIDDFIDVGSNIQLGNAGVITATTFKGDGDFVELDVDGHTNLDNVSIAGVTTISGDLRIESALPSIYLTDTNSNPDYLLYNSNGNFEIRDPSSGTRFQVLSSGTVRSYGNFIAAKDLDVDGHTNLDNVSVAGVSTFAGNADFSSGIDVTGHATVSQSLTVTGTTSLGETVNITGNDPNITFVDSNNNPDYKIFANAGTFLIHDYTNGNDIFKVQTDGHLDITPNTDFAAGIDVTGNATVSGNLSVGGVLTYEDVTNIDSVGIITARQGVRLGVDGTSSANYISVGAGNDLKIWHQTSNNHSYISESGSGSLIVLADDFYVQDTSTGTMISAKEGAEVNLHHNTALKLSTTSTGANVTSANDAVLQVTTSGTASTDDARIELITQESTFIFQNDRSLGTDGGLTVGDGTKTYFQANKDGAVQLFNGSGTKVLETNSLGVTIGDNVGLSINGGTGNRTGTDATLYVDKTNNNDWCAKFKTNVGSSNDYGLRIECNNNATYPLVVNDGSSNQFRVNGNGNVYGNEFHGDGSNLTGVVVGLSTEQVTPSSNVATLDLTKDDHKIVASGTYTITCTGGTEAENHTIRIENSGTANVGFSSYFKFPSGGTPSLPTTNGAISLISFTVHKVGSVGIATVLLSGASVNYS